MDAKGWTYSPPGLLDETPVDESYTK